MIITYYKKGYSKRSTVNKFEIEPKQLCNWIKNKKKLISITPYIQKLNIDTYPKFLYLEDKLMKQFIEAKDQLKTVTQVMIQVKAYFWPKKYHISQNILI